jgi:hypothetical protein
MVASLYGFGSRRVLAYPTSRGGLAEIIFSSGEIFGIPNHALRRPDVQWLGSLHCIM